MPQDPTTTAPGCATVPDRLLRLPSVEAMTGLKRTSIYARIKEDPPTFPAPIKLGKRASAWSEASVQAWIADRIKSSRAFTSVQAPVQSGDESHAQAEAQKGGA
jgi:prophage regulatory protein